MDNLAEINLAGLEILVMLKGVVLGGVVVVGWALGLVERRVLLTHLLLVAESVVEVQVGEDAVVGHRVVGGGGLVVVQMRETGAVVRAEVGRHVLVAIVDGIGLLALEVLEHVMLHDRVLLDGTSVSAGGLTGDAVANGEDVLVFTVLEGVAVDVNLTLAVADTSIKQELVLTRGRVNVGTHEVLLDGFTRVDVFENSDLASGILTDGHHLPAEVNLDTTLSALLKSDLIGVGESINALVGGPVLDASTSGSTTDKLILTHNRLVVEGVEVSTLALVGHSGRVVDVVATGMDKPVVEVATEALLLVELVHEDVVGFRALVERREAVNELARVIEASAEDESLISHSLAVCERDRVVSCIEFAHLARLDLRPGVNHGGHGSRLHLQLFDVLVENAEVGLRLDPDGLVGDHGDLKISRTRVLLDKLGESSAVRATNENNIEVRAFGINRGLFDSAASEAARSGRNERAIKLLLLQAAGEEPVLHLDLDC